MNQKEVLDKIKSQGMRLTEARREIIDVLVQKDGLVTASEVMGELSKSGRNVDKATVYRNISKLEELGLILKVSLKDNVDRYELDLGHHHHHLVCLKCDKIIEADMKDLEPIMDKVEKRLEKDHSFKIKSHSVEFYGECGDC